MTNGTSYYNLWGKFTGTKKGNSISMFSPNYVQWSSQSKSFMSRVKLVGNITSASSDQSLDVFLTGNIQKYFKSTKAPGIGILEVPSSDLTLPPLPGTANPNILRIALASDELNQKTQNFYIIGTGLSSQADRLSVLRLTGNSWTVLIDDLVGTVNSFEIYQDHLWMTGKFSGSGVVEIQPNIGTWSISRQQWSNSERVIRTMDSAINLNGITFLPRDEKLVFGQFESVLSVPCLNICLWKDNRWVTLNGGNQQPYGVRGTIRVAKATESGLVFMGGDFTNIQVDSGLIESQFLALYDWKKLTISTSNISPIPGPVIDIALLNDKLVAVAGRYGFYFLFYWNMIDALGSRVQINPT